MHLKLYQSVFHRFDIAKGKESIKVDLRKSFSLTMYSLLHIWLIQGGPTRRRDIVWFICKLNTFCCLVETMWEGGVKHNMHVTIYCSLICKNVMLITCIFNIYHSCLGQVIHRINALLRWYYNSKVLQVSSSIS